MKIRRELLEDLHNWKESKDRKPILLKGARQTGKTWIMKEFGKECFDYVADFNFDRDIELNSIFEKTKATDRIVKELSLYTNVPILPGKTLIIFDEIQMSEGALNSLKYFCEDAPEYHVIAAGSLLGVAIRQKNMSVPVGKVEILHLYPVSFREFLHTSDERSWRYINQLKSIEPLPEIIHHRLELEYKRYLVTGGMPEAITTLLENKGMLKVDEVLQHILDLYQLDFSRYASPVEIPRINSLWNSLPSQLAKENRKFIYRIVRSGARAREYEDGLLWLEEAGLIYRIFNVSKPAIPLSGYQDLSAFKIYACDCGLLRRLAKLSPEVIMNSNVGFTEFKGALTENFVLQSLMLQNDAKPFYWSSGNKAEVDFIWQMDSGVVPIEVKSETRISGKSLSVYSKQFKPPVRVRISMNNLRENDGLLSCPIPLSDWLRQIMGVMKTKEKG
ncbi:MAG: ATP-binding protein [Proteiniphilum sp.]|nr:ATP-binding protein [Proteiniphilum sp.]MDD3333045.1 ATP-binding protein [Proteiniphilum sp.]MDD3556075.1 ATP-binding protein [Proteiniphilum sp.]MDD3979936.1 ATP-binding protein [Proteiniphilum sp.]MDD5346845.1 ATP-binding protein [Proteiniphilum sp.]